MRTAIMAGVLAGGAGALFSFMARGKLTLDLGWGRSLHPVGPLALTVDAPRDLVFEQLSSPYLGRLPRDLQGHLEILERGDDTVVARHRTKVMFYTAETVESVRFEAPERITFRHLRGPVPHAVETFELNEHDGVTELVYDGEIGIDFWALGRLAGRHWVVPEWRTAVNSHLGDATAAAEKRAEARRRRETRAASDS